MRIYIIGNPIAGAGKASRLIKKAKKLLEGAGYKVEILLTGGPGEASRKVQALAPAADVLFVVGGDGTLNEVVNGLSDPSEVPIAFLPAGTGNVVACELGLTSDPKAVAASIRAGRVRKMDMGLAGGRRFLMVGSVGFDALVTEQVAKMRRGKLGFKRYLIPILRTIRKYRPPELVVRLDGSKTVEGSLLIVTKTPYYGGIFTVARSASCDSGWFDVCVLRNGSVSSLIRCYSAAYRDRLPRCPGVRFFRAKRVEVTAAEPTSVEVDGDFLGTTPVVFKLIPGAVRMFV